MGGGTGQRTGLWVQRVLTVALTLNSCVPSCHFGCLLFSSSFVTQGFRLLPEAPSGNINVFCEDCCSGFMVFAALLPYPPTPTPHIALVDIFSDTFYQGKIFVNLHETISY